MICFPALLRLLFVAAALLMIPSALFSDISYDVEFCGELSKESIAILKSASKLVSLEEFPTTTLTALRRRANADIPNLINALQSLGYYNPVIEIEINAEIDPVKINIHVNPGPVFCFGSFDIEGTEEEIQIRNLGVIIGKPALPKIILDAEIALLSTLAKRGYPLAEVVDRCVEADLCESTVNIVLRVETGPLAYFGPVRIEGLCEVEPIFILQKLTWIEGEVYCPLEVMRTQNALEASGLFSSIMITPEEEADENGYLPMVIEVSEGYQHTISVGASYNTDWGPGVTGEWEDRNVRGLGEKLGIRADIWYRRQRGSISYMQPDFLCANQNVFWVAEVEHEKTYSFTEKYFSISCIVERQLTENARFSYGGTFKRLESEDSDDNGIFSLVKAPMRYHWSNANNLLDPTRGQSLNYKVTPTLAITRPYIFYLIQSLVGTTYYAITEDRRFILALRAQFGSITGASDSLIPPPERLYAGSENTLRGYKYLTVSPLDANGNPRGGRSLMIYSAELRKRFTEEFGGTLFYEIGNVYDNEFPDFKQKQLQSVGIGLRYHTPVGPLRMDIAFPLNPRKHIDPSFQLYFSIGQAF